MPVPKGVHVGGRKKGTPNKRTLILQDRLARWKCDPFEVLSMIARGELLCGVCRGTGKTSFQPARGLEKTAKRTCESCYGSGKERISPGERCKAAAELAQYMEPKRKAIEVRATDGAGETVTLEELVKVLRKFER